jgi:hypothetical protein
MDQLPTEIIVKILGYLTKNRSPSIFRLARWQTSYFNFNPDSFSKKLTMSDWENAIALGRLLISCKTIESIVYHLV